MRPLCEPLGNPPQRGEERIVRPLPTLREEDMSANLNGERRALSRPVEQSALFDAVVADEGERVLRIEVKSRNVDPRWVWGAFRIPGRIYHELHDYWRARGADDDYVGILVNAWLARGG